MSLVGSNASRVFFYSFSRLLEVQFIEDSTDGMQSVNRRVGEVA
jgi:hypothetical protein